MSNASAALPPAPFEAAPIGESPAFRRCLETLRKAAQADSTVLVTGESGTGKEVAARALHDWSPRRNGPFVAINCAAIPENLMESELFGHGKGAFTGALADRPGKFASAEGGTVFLDEIGDLAPSMQGKLLRVLQERSVDPVGGPPVRVDFRLVAATHRDLREEVRRGRFRGDLYFRIHIVPVELPPLRQRAGDALLLARHFLDRFNRRYGRSHRFTPEQERRVLGYPWPGNVRELANAVERAVVLADAEGLVLEPETPEPGLEVREGVRGHRREAECSAIRRALEMHRWNKARAAAHLGISRRGLFYKIKEYGIR